jgi:hypothetical protein
VSWESLITIIRHREPDLYLPPPYRTVGDRPDFLYPRTPGGHLATMSNFHDIRTITPIAAASAYTMVTRGFVSLMPCFE